MLLRIKNMRQLSDSITLSFRCIELEDERQELYFGIKIFNEENFEEILEDAFNNKERFYQLDDILDISNGYIISNLYLQPETSHILELVKVPIRSLRLKGFIPDHIEIFDQVTSVSFTDCKIPQGYCELIVSKKLSFNRCKICENNLDYIKTLDYYSFRDCEIEDDNTTLQDSITVNNFEQPVVSIQRAILNCCTQKQLDEALELPRVHFNNIDLRAYTINNVQTEFVVFNNCDFPNQITEFKCCEKIIFINCEITDDLILGFPDIEKLSFNDCNIEAVTIDLI